MKKNKANVTKLVIVCLLIMSIFLSPVMSLMYGTVFADSGAILKISPASGSYVVGDSFQVSVRVDTGGKAINTVKAYINFSADKLEVTSADYETGSFIQYWIEKVYDNATGLIHLQGGLPNPGYTGADGVIATFVFKVKGEGNATITFDTNNCKVLENSPIATDLLSSVINANYVLTSTGSSLHHFSISNISSPQVTNTPFSVTVLAKNQDDSVYTGFNGTVSLTVNKGSINPSSITLTNGSWTGNVTITGVNAGVVITATNGDKMGSSNAFDVIALPATLDHFEFATIGNQVTGVPFNITITAKDQYGATFAGFTGNVTLSVNKGVILPSTINMVNGSWTGNVTITGVNTGVVITATSGSVTGYSNTFDVTTPGPITGSYISLTRSISTDTGFATYTMGEPIVGTVAAMGGAVPPASVVLKDNTNNIVAMASVDAYGQFSIPTIQASLGEGTYIVDAGIAQVTVYLKYGIESVSPVTAPVVGSMYVPVTGRLFYGNMTRIGVPGVTVAVFGPSGSIIASGQTYQDGSFVTYVNFSSPGQYYLRVSDNYMPNFVANYYTWTIGPTELSVSLVVNPTLIYAIDGEQTFTVRVSNPRTNEGILGLTESNFSYSSGVQASLVRVEELGAGYYNITVNPRLKQGSEIFKVASATASGYVTVSYQALGDWNPQLYVVPGFGTSPQNAKGLAIGTNIEFVYSTLYTTNPTWRVKFISSDSGPTGSMLVKNDSYPDPDVTRNPDSATFVRTIQSGGQIKFHVHALLWDNMQDPLSTQANDVTRDFILSPTVEGDTVTCSINSASVNDTINVTVTVTTSDNIEANNRTVTLVGPAGMFKYPAPTSVPYIVSADGSTVTLNAYSTNIVGGKYIFSGLTLLKQGYVEVKAYKGTSTSPVLTADLTQAIKVSPKIVTLSADVKHFVLGEDLYRSVKISGAVKGLLFTPNALTDNGDGSYTFFFTPSNIDTLKHNNAKGESVVTIQAYSADGSTLYTIDIPVVRPVLQITSAHKDGLITKGIPEVVTFKLLNPDTNKEISFSSSFLIAQYTSWDIYDNLPVSAFVVPTSSGSKLIVSDWLASSASSPVVVAYGSKYVDYTKETATIGVKVVANGVTITFPKALTVASPVVTFKNSTVDGLNLYYDVINKFSITVADAHGNGVPGVQVVGIAPYSLTSAYLFGGITDSTGFVSFMYTPTYVGEIDIDLLNKGVSLLDERIPVKVIPVPPDTTAPTITIAEPEDNANITTSTVTVKGVVKDDSTSYDKLKVYLNDTITVTLRPDGTFVQTVDLTEGTNIIKVTAFDATGNKAEKGVTVKYEAPPKPVVTTIIIQIGFDIIKVNGKGIQIDAPAEIVNGRTFLPLRAIAEAFGAEVEWLPDTRGISITLGDTVIALQIGSKVAMVNDKQLSVDPAPYIKNGRTMVPVRFISEAFGASVDWDAINKIVTITL